MLNIRKSIDVYKLQVGVLDKLGMRSASSQYDQVDDDGGVLTTKK